MTFLVHNEPVAALLGPSTRSRVRIRGPQSSGGSRSRSRTCEVSPPLTSPGSLGPQASETRGRAGNYTGGTAPDEPSLTGYTFGGWYYDDETFANQAQFPMNTARAGEKMRNEGV